MQITQTCYSRSALGSTIAAPGDPGKGAPVKAYPYAPHPPSIEPTFTPSQPRVIRTALHLTYRVAIISTHQGLSPRNPHSARISRQNVSLVVVLERRALNFKFSYTFPLNGTGRQKEERERRGRSERRHGRWSRSKAGALDPEGGRAGEGIGSAEAAIISRHHYLYALEIYANAISGKRCWTKQLRRAGKGDCIC